MKNKKKFGELSWNKSKFKIFACINYKKIKNSATLGFKNLHAKLRMKLY